MTDTWKNMNAKSKQKNANLLYAFGRLLLVLRLAWESPVGSEYLFKKLSVSGVGHE